MNYFISIVLLLFLFSINYLSFISLKLVYFCYMDAPGLIVARSNRMGDPELGSSGRSREIGQIFRDPSLAIT